eukprot:CAMPEP_0176482442 /NCGR_PEP_ID=MMETSP0200_2-20121128/3377_1 /TAXON_ID=947934 /ORGANISM="Chaetoceros sp., Strain GSL56" /LENGTH=893 /DNA_ID=CAMNT_0017878757 /DNA_START=159 /DNA_END=2837 /DNA_ORIENTATION=-
MPAQIAATTGRMDRTDGVGSSSSLPLSSTVQVAEKGPNSKRTARQIHTFSCANNYTADTEYTTATTSSNTSDTNATTTKTTTSTATTPCSITTTRQRRPLQPLMLGSPHRNCQPRIMITKLPKHKAQKNKKKNFTSCSYWGLSTSSVGPIVGRGTSSSDDKKLLTLLEKKKSNHLTNVNVCGYWNSIKYLASKPWRKRKCNDKEQDGDNDDSYIDADEDEDEDEEDSFVDPLAAIIEKARNASNNQRVRLVRFNLDQNQILDLYDCSSTISVDDATTVRIPLRSNRPSILYSPMSAAATASVSTTAGNVSSIMNHGDVSKCDWKQDSCSCSNDASSFASPTSTSSKSTTLPFNFQEEPKISNQIQSLVKRGRNYHSRYKFSKAARQYLEALKKLNRYSYPIQHPLQQSVQQAIREMHHAHLNLEHSTNIVKIGINLESKGKLIKALKMYTVALRIRKESLGIHHPSIPMLLNLLGSVQVKRGQYEDAMEIFELALYERKGQQRPQDDDNNNGEFVHQGVQRKNASISTRAVSMREIGSIHEHFGRLDKAMVMYRQSLDCLMQNPRIVQITECYSDTDKEKRGGVDESNFGRDRLGADDSSAVCESLEICVVSAVSTSCSTTCSLEETEIYLQESLSYDSDCGMRNISKLGFFYDSFFQRQEIKAKRLALCVVSILHCIAKVHHQQHEYSLATSSYHASLRGMKLIHGERHETIAVILVNIGNLLKDMKDYERAHDMYQSALKIESLRLGYSHTNVLISMFNIASVESCRGRYDESIALYKELIQIHKSRHQDNKNSMRLLLDAHCFLGDVYEKIGKLNDAIECYKQALTVSKTASATFQSDTGKLLHKLGILCSSNEQYKDAESFFLEALVLYESGSIMDERIVQVERDKADN